MLKYFAILLLICLVNGQDFCEINNVEEGSKYVLDVCENRTNSTICSFSGNTQRVRSCNDICSANNMQCVATWGNRDADPCIPDGGPGTDGENNDPQWSLGCDWNQHNDVICECVEIDKCTQILQIYGEDVIYKCDINEENGVVTVGYNRTTGDSGRQNFIYDFCRSIDYFCNNFAEEFYCNSNYYLDKLEFRCEKPKFFEKPEILPENIRVYIMDRFNLEYTSPCSKQSLEHIYHENKIFFLDGKDDSRTLQEAICYSIGYDYGNGCGLPGDNPEPLMNGEVRHIFNDGGKNGEVLDCETRGEYGINITDTIYLYSNTTLRGYIGGEYGTWIATELIADNNYRKNNGLEREPMMIVNNGENVRFGGLNFTDNSKYKDLNYQVYVENSTLLLSIPVTLHLNGLYLKNTKNADIEHNYYEGDYGVDSFIDKIALENSELNLRSDMSFGRFYYENLNQETSTVDIINDLYTNDDKNKTISCSQYCDDIGKSCKGGSKLYLHTDIDRYDRYIDHVIDAETELKNNLTESCDSTESFLCVCEEKIPECDKLREMYGENITECSIDLDGVLTVIVQDDFIIDDFIRVRSIYDICKNIDMVCHYDESVGRCYYEEEYREFKCEKQRFYEESDVLQENNIVYLTDYHGDDTCSKEYIHHMNPDKKIFFVGEGDHSRVIQEVICYSIGYEYGNGCGLPGDNPLPLVNGIVRYEDDFGRV